MANPRSSRGQAATPAEMADLHRLLIATLTARLDPKVTSKRPGVELLAVVAAVMRQEGMSAGTNRRLQADVRKLERLYVAAVLKAMAVNPTPTVVAEAGKLMRVAKSGHDAPMVDAPMGVDRLAGLDLPFAD